MSRAIVMRTISKLNKLVDDEEGVNSSEDDLVGGVRIAYGRGLVASPAPFGAARKRRTRASTVSAARMPSLRPKARKPRKPRAMMPMVAECGSGFCDTAGSMYGMGFMPNTLFPAGIKALSEPYRLALKEETRRYKQSGNKLYAPQKIVIVDQWLHQGLDPIIGEYLKYNINKGADLYAEFGPGTRHGPALLDVAGRRVPAMRRRGGAPIHG